MVTRQKIPVINNFTLVILLIITNTAIGQVSFSKDIAPIIFSNCTYCHVKAGYTPFPLENYEEITANINSIKYVVNSRIMPPWKASPDCPGYLNERHLSDSEIKAINEWIAQGFKNDNKNLTYKKNGTKQIYGESLGKPDLILKPSKPYTQGTNSEDAFISYIMNIGIKSDVTLRAIVLKPGPAKIVHHARLEYDSARNYLLFSKPETYFETPIIPDSINLPPIGFYVPGLNHIIFPKGTGYTISPKGQFVLFLHYSPLSKTETDQTEVWLYFNKKPVDREIHCVGYAYKRHETILPKDSITEITEITDPVASKFTITCVEPHLHLLGQSIKISIIRSNSNDVTLLANVPKWDFNWQEVYLLKKPIILDVGDRLLINATFDNTKNNPKNPFFPPRDVSFGGMSTTNEMINVMIMGMDYKNGDENLDLSY